MHVICKYIAFDSFLFFFLFLTSPKETAVAEISVMCLRNSTRHLMTTILSKIKRSLVFNPVYTELQDRGETFYA